MPAPPCDSRTLPEPVLRDIAAVTAISAVPALLQVICDFTGMGFAAVARVTADSWTVCASRDTIGMGLKPGDQLPIETTLCNEARMAQRGIVIDNVAESPLYREHHTPRIYGFQSYVSVPIVRKDGQYFGNLCAIDPSPAVVSDSRTTMMFALFADLIALQLQSEDQRQAAESALLRERATAELREQFIAVLGHDLRNPVAAVGATAEVLIRRTTEPEAAKHGERLRTITRRMSALLDDVMDFARGQMGSGIGLGLRPVKELDVALTAVVAELQVANPNRAIISTFAIDRAVCCDVGRVLQLASNLLGNAITHGAPKEPVTVSARIEADDLILCVQNGGEPIPPSSLSHLFEPYWRPVVSNSRGGGLGLGLYISHEIVKAHGGTLQVSSGADGTRFVATLPVAGPDGSQGLSIPRSA